MAEHDYDWIVIGSGFGGSVSALRLAEKGYRVAVLEAGRRFRDEDFATTTWNARRYYWLPRLGLKGILRMTLFKDIFVVSGCGVGGGSLGFANTLYRPTPGSAFYRDPQWAGLEEWESALAPHYETAERMLGVTRYEGEGPADRMLREIAAELGVEDTYSTTRVGVFFGEPGETVPDPYFGGEGPPRAGCIRCGACMVGCRHNAKNTLVKNYLWFAERHGVEILPERTVSVIEPLGAPDGSGGYAVTAERSGAWLSKERTHAHRPGRGDRRGRARHQPAAAALPPPRRAPAALEPHRPPRAHQLRGDLGRHHQERPPRLHQVDRDHLELLSRPGHPHRERHLRTRRRLDGAPVHDPRRRPAQVRAPAVPAQVVAPHGDHPRPCRRSTTRCG